MIEATLIHANPAFAHVKLPSGVETTVNIRDIAPLPSQNAELPDDTTIQQIPNSSDTRIESNDTSQLSNESMNNNFSSDNETEPIEKSSSEATPSVRCSGRKRNLPAKFNDFDIS